MSHAKASYEDGTEKAPGMFFLRDELDCENLGFTVVDVDGGWSGMEHDHADGGHEEVYYLVDGSATIDIEGTEVAMEPGDAVRVAPRSSRQLSAAEPSTFVVAGAP
ncbi:MAG: cupin domain-containing protein [Haloquadratum sp.]